MTIPAVKTVYGAVSLPGDASDDLQAATKGYVDDAVAEAGGGGSTILSGTATPTAGTGAVGDYYLDTDNQILYGPKAVAATDEYVTQTLSSNGLMTAGTYGMKYRFAIAGYVSGVRVFVAATSATPSEVYLFRKSDSTMLASKDFTATLDAWNTVIFDTPVAVSVGVTYIAAFYMSGQMRYAGGGYAGQVSGNVTALADGVDGTASTYTAGRDTFPTTNTGATAGVSPIFNATLPWPVALYGTTNILVLSAAAAVPGGTPAGTVIFRTVT